MLSILHISDIHLGPPFNAAAAEALLQIAPNLEPDLIVASGDFTQRAKKQQFADARELLDRLPQVPMVVIPGNHDVPLYRLWERLLDPMKNYREFIHQELEMRMRVEGAVIVALDTTAPWLTITRGRIASRQIEFAARSFEQAGPGEIKIVVVHHQLVPAPDALTDRRTLGGRNALAQFAEMGVELVLAGHLHRSYVGNSLDYVLHRPPDQRVLLVQSGTTCSWRGRGREKRQNSFNHVHVHNDRLEVRNYLLSEASGEFELCTQQVFARRGHRLRSP